MTKTVPREVLCAAFGRVLVALRRRGPHNQVAMAQLLSVSQATYSRMERGEALPDVLTYRYVAEHLGLTVSAFERAMDDALTVALPAARAALRTPGATWDEIVAAVGIVPVLSLFDFAACVVVRHLDALEEDK